MRRFETLDLMRGVAAMAVLLLHCSSSSSVKLAQHGYLAVDLFFCLSGFVVAHAYSSKLHHGLGVSQFARIRAKRLWPLICLGVVGGVLGYVNLYDTKELIVLLTTGIILIPTTLGALSEARPLFALNPPSWSLMWESIINIIFARILFRLTDKSIIILTILSGLSLAGIAVAMGSINAGSSLDCAWVGGARVTFSFTAGLAIYRLRSAGMLLNIQVPAMISISLLVVILGMPNLAWGNGLFDAVSAVVVLPGLVVSAINAAPTRFRALSRLLGRASYPAYILQGGLIPHIRGAHNHVNMTDGMETLFNVLAMMALYLGLYAISVPYEYVASKLLPEVPKVRLPASGAP